MPFSRYFHTLRHLKPVQFYGRLWFRLYRPKPDLSPPPALRETASAWVLPAQRGPSLLGPQHFHFLNEERQLADVGWMDTDDKDKPSKLWRYNQHYFDDLNASGSECRAEWHRDLLANWVAENPPGKGDGWEPYPTSLRIVNWVKWALAGNVLPDACIASLAVQARWLTRRLEIHLLGNHLFANAKALVFAGCFFEGEEADRWLRTGFKILCREVPEQILADGGHFERSTMYHALALEDMLDLINVLTCAGQSADVRAKWQLVIPNMVAWLQGMSHPDGEIAFFNDAALDVAPPCTALLDYARRLGISANTHGTGPAWFRDSGYVRLQNDNAVLLFDAAPVGPDYLPGHAHADTLSFELSLYGQRVFVNSGTSEYGLSEERLRQRGTKAHNTLAVNDENSSEVWGGFRVARRAYPSNVQVELEGPSQIIVASHDGYRRLASPVNLERSMRLQSGSLLIEDRVQGVCSNAVAFFYLHPSVAVNPLPGAGVLLKLPQGREVHMEFEGNGELAIEPATWHPRFGVVEPNHRIVVTLNGSRLVTRIEWSSQ